MTDLNLPPPAPDPGDIPKYLQFPRDMTVEMGSTPISWFVNHTTGYVWLWLRTPLDVRAVPFQADKAMFLADALTEHAVAAAQLAIDTQKLVEVRAPLLGPNGQVFPR